MSLDRAHIDVVLPSKLLHDSPPTSPDTCPPLGWKMHLFRWSCLEELPRRQLLEGDLLVHVPDAFTKLS